MENYFNTLKSKIYKNFAPTTSSRDIDALYNRSSSKKLTEKFKKRHTTISVKTFKDWANAVDLASHPERPNRILLEELYESLSLDAHLETTTDTRVLTVQQSKFVIIDQNGNENEELSKLFKKTWFQDLIRTIIMTQFTGSKVLEIFETNEDGEVLEIPTIDPAHVNDVKKIILKEPGDEHGYSYADSPYSRYYVQVGKPGDLGIYSKLGPLVLGKKLATGSWLDYIEKFGIPPRWVVTDREDTERLEELFEMMKSMVSNHFAVLRGQEKIELANTPGTDAHKVFNEFIGMVNSEISQRILGQDGTTNHKDSNGTYGSLKVLEGVAKVRHESDKVLVRNVLNDDIIPRLIQLSPVYTGLANHTLEWDLSEELSVVELLLAVTQLAPHFTIDTEYLSTKTGIPLSQKVVSTTDVIKKKDELKASVEIDTLYNKVGEECCGAHQNDSIDAVYIGDWSKTIDTIATELHNGRLKPEHLSKDLIQKTYGQLNAGAKKGYGKNWIAYNPQYPLTQKQLKANLWRFSQAKTYQQLLEMRDMLVEDGKILPFGKFKEKVIKVHKAYNINYLQAEYQTALKSAQSSRKWQGYQKNKHLFPNLIYKTVGDDRVREEHQILDGIIKPIDDAFWNTHMPPNGFRCRCYTQPTTEQPTSSEETPDVVIDEAFQNNPGRTNKVFNDKHAYFKMSKDEVRNMRVKFELSKADAPYTEIYQFGKYKLKASPFADESDYKGNVEVAKVIVTKIKVNIDIRHHINNVPNIKNYEYLIDGIIKADRKTPTGYDQIRYSFKSAREQQIEMIVFDLSSLELDTKMLIQKLKGEVTTDRNKSIKGFIFVYNKQAVRMSRTEILNNKWDKIKTLKAK